MRNYIKTNPVIVFLYWLPVRLFLSLAKFFPLQNKIIFDNFCGRGLGDDPKYILLSLIKKKTKVKYIWLVNDLNEIVPNGVIKVKFGSWQAKYHYLTAKIWIDNVKSNAKPPKRKKQFYIQTWHSIFTTKILEQDAEQTLSSDYVHASKEDSKKIDLMYANNDFNCRLFRKSFWYKGKVLKKDSPHLSILFQDTHDIKEKIYFHYKIPPEKKILLYAPTFRKEFDLNDFRWDYNKVMKAIEKKFGGNFVLLAKFHPNITNQMKSFNSTYFKNVSNYPDVTELIAVSDILITDLSSVAYEMATTKKPVFLFMKGLDKYTQTDRAQYMPLSQLPFSIAKTAEELILNIEHFQETKYHDSIANFFKKIGLEDFGRGAEDISNIVVNTLSQKKR